MSIGCNCASGLSNTGRPNCVSLQSVTSKLIMVPLFGADGRCAFFIVTVYFLVFDSADALVADWAAREISNTAAKSECLKRMRQRIAIKNTKMRVTFPLN